LNLLLNYLGSQQQPQAGPVDQAYGNYLDKEGAMRLAAPGDAQSKTYGHAKGGGSGVVSGLCGLGK